MQLFSSCFLPCFFLFFIFSFYEHYTTHTNKSLSLMFCFLFASLWQWLYLQSFCKNKKKLKLLHQRALAPKAPNQINFSAHPPSQICKFLYHHDHACPPFFLMHHYLCLCLLHHEINACPLSKLFHHHEINASSTQ